MSGRPGRRDGGRAVGHDARGNVGVLMANLHLTRSTKDMHEVDCAPGGVAYVTARGLVELAKAGVPTLTEQSPSFRAKRDKVDIFLDQCARRGMRNAAGVGLVALCEEARAQGRPEAFIAMLYEIMYDIRHGDGRDDPVTRKRGYYDDSDGSDEGDTGLPPMTRPSAGGSGSA